MCAEEELAHVISEDMTSTASRPIIQDKTFVIEKKKEKLLHRLLYLKTKIGHNAQDEIGQLSSLNMCWGGVPIKKDK